MIQITPDHINGTFEILGGYFILRHCFAVMKDKAVAGVSIISTAFFAAWGIWNLYYYPHLDQWWSFAGGLAIVASNIFWIVLLLRYRKPGEAIKPMYRCTRCGKDEFEARETGCERGPCPMKEVGTNSTGPGGKPASAPILETIQ